MSTLLLGEGGFTLMLALPLLTSPPEPGVLAAPARREQRSAGAPSHSDAKETTTSYSGPVALAYVIPISVTVTSVGLFFATRHGGHTAGGFLLGGAVGLIGGVVAPPVVHVVHGNVGAGVASFTGSLLSTTAGGFVGLLVTADAWADRRSDDDTVRAQILGVTGGAVVFQGLWGLIDSNELAEKHVEGKAPERATRRPTATVLAVPVENGAMLGIRGTF